MKRKKIQCLGLSAKNNKKKQLIPQSLFKDIISFFISLQTLREGGGGGGVFHL